MPAPEGYRNATAALDTHGEGSQALLEEVPDDDELEAMLQLQDDEDKDEL